MATMTTTAFTDAIKTQYETRLLTRALPRLVHGKFGSKATLSKKGSYELRKYNGYNSVISTPLQEGVTPTEQDAPTMTKITITPVWYGAWIGYTDLMPMEVMDPVISEVSGILGEQAGNSIDQLFRSELVGSATIDYSGGVSAIGSLEYPAHEISFLDILIQIAELEAAGALPPDGGKFPVIIHPHTWASLMADPLFSNMFVEEKDPIRTGRLGTLLNCSFYSTSNAYEQADTGYGSTTDVYSALFIGKDSYGSVSFAGWQPKDVDTGEGPATGKGGSQNPVSLIAKQLGSSGADDPLDQRGTIAWKTSFVAEVLNSAWIRNLKHTNMFSNM